MKNKTALYIMGGCFGIILFCIGVTVGGVFLIVQLSDETITSDSGCTLSTNTFKDNGADYAYKVASFYACEKDENVETTEEFTSDNEFAVDGYSYTVIYNKYRDDGVTYFEIIKLKEGGEPIGDEGSYATYVFPNEMNMQIVAPIIFLNERYIVFKFDTTGFLECGSDLSEEFFADDCYTEADKENHSNYGGYWGFDIETKEFDPIVRTSIGY